MGAPLKMIIKYILLCYGKSKKKMKNLKSIVIINLYKSDYKMENKDQPMKMMSLFQSIQVGRTP